MYGSPLPAAGSEALLPVGLVRQVCVPRLYSWASPALGTPGASRGISVHCCDLSAALHATRLTPFTTFALMHL